MVLSNSLFEGTHLYTGRKPDGAKEQVDQGGDL